MNTPQPVNARQILRGETHLVSRRTILQHMLLRPDEQMNQILIYLLAAIAHRCGIQVHAFCAMSDHIHLVVTDVRGNLPAFSHAFHLLVARCTKVLRGWDEPVWDKDPTSVVHLKTETAVVEKIAYVIANPVTAGLVRHAHEWPGAKTLVDDIGQGTLEAGRPKVYLNQKSRKWPERMALPITLPPYIDAARGDAFRAQVAAEVARLEAHAHAEMEAQRRSVLGAEQAVIVPPTARAKKDEPAVDRNPRFAVGRNQGDAGRQAAAALRAFHASYRAALEQWRAGKRDAVFPEGTWWMRVFHGAAVAGAGALASTA